MTDLTTELRDRLNEAERKLIDTTATLNGYRSTALTLERERNEADRNVENLLGFLRETAEADRRGCATRRRVAHHLERRAQVRGR